MSLRDIEYKVNKSLGPVDKILKAVKNPQSVLQSGDIGRKIQSANQTVNSIKRLVDRIDDTLLSKADDGFFSKSSSAVNRVSEDVLKLNRFASNLDEKKYNSQITPEGKISGNKDLGDLQYPPELGEYYLGITFVDYDRPDLFQPAKRENPTSIYLPVPAQLLENHSTGWQDVNQGILGNASQQVANWANGGEMPDLSTLAATYGMQAGQNIARSLIDNSGLASVLGVSGEAAVSVFQQYVGAIPNPSVALIFMGPTLREYAFSWKFHPESADESMLLKKIINEFKKSMLPNLKFQNALNMLGYPRICELKLYPDEYLFEMKRCAITNIAVNYAPNGVPTFFKGTKAPTSIEFTVYLKEIEYFLAEDFGRESGNQTISDTGVQ
jgi:hypothetical protein